MNNPAKERPPTAAAACAPMNPRKASGTGTLWEYVAFRLALRPAPMALVALYLSLRWRARVSFSADITYPFRLRLGRGVRIGRCKIYCPGVMVLGDHVSIHDGAILDAAGGSIVFGEWVQVNPYCALFGAGGLTIGRNTGIGIHSVIIASNHGIDDLEVPMMRQPLRKVGISIAENVWIGANCVVLDGVTIHEGAVVAAGAVVSRDVGREDVVGGVPARVLKNRRREAARRAASSLSPLGRNELERNEFSQ